MNAPHLVSLTPQFLPKDSVEADRVVQPKWGQRNKPRGLDEIPDIKFDKFICCALGAGD